MLGWAYMPSLEAYLKPVHEQMDPEAGIEEEYKQKVKEQAKTDIFKHTFVDAENLEVD